MITKAELFPHKTLKAMRSYLKDTSCLQSGHKRYYLYFNVKAHFADFTVEHLFNKRAEVFGGQFDKIPEDTQFAMFIRAYNEIGTVELWNWAIEDAQRSVNDDDFYRTTRVDDKPIEVKFEFMGRSGGYAVPVEYNYSDMGDFSCKEDWDDWIDGMESESLRRLYRQAREWGSALNNANASAMLEDEALYHILTRMETYVEEEEDKAAKSDAFNELRATVIGRGKQCFQWGKPLDDNAVNVVSDKGWYAVNHLYWTGSEWKNRVVIENTTADMAMGAAQSQIDALV